MMTRLFCLILLLSVNQIIYSQVAFEKAYGGAAEEICKSIEITPDGGYIIFGQSQSYGAGGWDWYAVKINANGDTSWTKTYGGSGTETSARALALNDGYLFVGRTNSFGAGGHDTYLVRTDLNGDTTWTKTYGGSGSERAKWIDTTTTGNLIMVGETTTFGNGNKDFYFIQTNPSGDTTMTRTYGGASRDDGVTVRQTPDGGFILFGITKSYGAGGFDWYLIKTMANGDTSWTRTYGNSGDDIPYHMVITPDSGYAMIGTFSTGIDSGQVTLIKADKNGTLDWIKHPHITTGDLGTALANTSDNGFILTGSTFDQAGSDILLLKTDDQGDSSWTATYGGPLNEVGWSVQQTADGGYVMVGQTEGFGTESFMDIYAVKVGPDGTPPCPASTDFTADQTTICQNEVVNFTSDHPTSSPYNWQVDDSTFTTNAQAAWFFANPGTFDIKLEICQQSSTRQITVHGLPTGFSYTVSDSTTIDFMLDAGIQASKVRWNFGDSSALDTVNPDPQHIYANRGIYNVVVDVTDNNGCFNTLYVQINLLDTTTNGIFRGNEASPTVSIYPHPLTSQSRIVTNDREIRSISFYDLTGRILKTILPQDRTLILHRRDWEPGMYFFTLEDSRGNRMNGKFIVP